LCAAIARLNGGFISGSAANRGFLINSRGVNGFNMKCGQQRQEELDKESANF
jgi:hypothetical protein